MSAEQPATVTTTDNELLMQFVRHRDEHAFRLLVERHASLLMAVCRGVSRHEHDAEDAFQATLLIMAGRAERLLNVTSLGGWLHRVAFRTALRARKRKQARRETLLDAEGGEDQTDVLKEIHAREMQLALHEELQQLPLQYRNVIVLCDIEGITRAEAANRLDCTEPSVKGALARGRRQLRSRLLKRGAVLSLAIGFLRQSCATENSSLTAETIESAVAQAASSRFSGDVGPTSDRVSQLAQEGVSMMKWANASKWGGAACAATVLVGVPLGLLGQIEVPSRAPAADVVLPQQDARDVESSGTAEVAVNDAGEAPAETAPQSSPQFGRNINSLVDQRLEALRQLVAAAEVMYRSGMTDLDSVVRAQQKLLDAELEAASSKEVRIKLRREQVDKLLQLEASVRERVNTGMGSQAHYLSVKAERLGAEILWQQETIAANSVGTEPENPPGSALNSEPRTGGSAVGLHRYELDTGDVLGLHIAGILGNDGDEAKPIVVSDPELPPAVGLPIPVHGDGCIHLPYVPPIPARGKTMQELHDLIRQAITVDQLIVTPGRERIVVTLMHRRTASGERALRAPVGPGDTLGIYVEGVLGSSRELPVIREGVLIPAIGVPVTVQADGNILLPLVTGVQVAGKTLPEIKELIRRAYTVDQTILSPNQEVIMVTLLKKFWESDGVENR